MRTLKILLVYPRPEVIKNWRFGYSLSLLRLAAVLKNAGHIIKYIDFCESTIEDDFFLSEAGKAEIIIIELDSFPLKRSSNAEHGLILAKLIKNYCENKFIIMMGNDCILEPGQRPFSDYIFDTEPEWRITHVIESYIQNKVIPVFNADLEEKLDILPFPDRSIVSEFAAHGGSINHKPNLAKSTLIQTSRGCLNTCSFCQRKGWFSKYREHSVEYTLREFALLSSEGFQNVWIADDNFSFHIDRAKRILTELRRENDAKNMKLSLSSWVHIDEYFLDAAAAAGVSIISFGVETTNPAIMHFYKKKIEIAHVDKIIRYADNIGIYTVGNFIIGAPMETESSIKSTLQFAMEVPFDEVNVKILDYMAGSDLYSGLPASLKRGKKHLFACKENGLNDFYLSQLRNIISIFNKDFSERRADKICKKIEKYGPPYHVL